MADETPKPFGDRLRDLINPALEDERAKAIQTDIVSNIFFQVADNLPKSLEKELAFFFNRVAETPERKRNPFIVNALTLTGQDGEANFNPIKKLQLPISTAFTNFSPEDIREMPGWIKLHEVCRDLNISIKLMSMTADESRGSLLPPLLIIDTSKTYLDGAIENSQLYPQLKDKPVEFNRKSGQDFNF